jgi:hypothetical protein
MSDVYESEMNPDDQPGDRLDEALTGADQPHPTGDQNPDLHDDDPDMQVTP